ncbi:MAG: hypothetical protein ACTSP4_00185 [Candidatus Hodarchaeales archaeon]
MKKVRNPVCKRCGRKPSVMGKEPMYLVPFGDTYFILCGGCQRKLLQQFGKSSDLDLSNLFTHIDEYHGFIGEFLRI